MRMNPGSTPTADLAAQLHDLRRAVTVIFVGLLILTLSALLFFWRQDAVARKNLSAKQAEAGKLIMDFETRYTAFVTQLHYFAQTNQDFVPILKQYTAQPNTPQ